MKSPISFDATAKDKLVIVLTRGKGLTELLGLVGIGEAESVEVTGATELELVLGSSSSGTGLAGNRLLDGYLCHRRIESSKVSEPGSGGRDREIK